jgi:hypothetical protein
LNHIPAVENGYFTTSASILPGVPVSCSDRKRIANGVSHCVNRDAVLPYGFRAHPEFRARYFGEILNTLTDVSGPSKKLSELDASLVPGGGSD